MTSVPAPLLKYASPKTAATHMAETEAGASGVVRGSSALSTAGDMMYTPIVDEVESAIVAKEAGLEAIKAFKKGDYGESGLQGLMSAFAAAGVVPVLGTIPRTAGKLTKKIAHKISDTEFHWFKGQKVFHSTSSGQAIIDSDVFNPVSNTVTADVGIHVGFSPLTSNNAAFHMDYKNSLDEEIVFNKLDIKKLKEEGFIDDDEEVYIKNLQIDRLNNELKNRFEHKSSFPLRLDPKLKTLDIPDMGAFKNPNNWLELLDSDEVTIKPEILKDLKEAAKEVLQHQQFQTDIFKDGKWVNYWDTAEGKGVWLNKLREVGIKHNFDSFKYKNYNEGHHEPMPLEDAEDSIMLMYPRQVKFENTKKKNWNDHRASKQKGGMIKTPSSSSPSKGSNVMRNPYNYEPKAI
jgi:hypothetical protein